MRLKDWKSGASIHRYDSNHSVPGFSFSAIILVFKSIFSSISLLMVPLFRLYTSVLAIASVLAFEIYALAVRDTTSDIATTKGGILVKNGEQTSCELGVIDSMAAFVPAKCLDFSGSSVNQTTVYEVYLDTGIDNTAAKYTVSSITVHPECNLTMSLNPIAVLQFNVGSIETWSNPIAINRNESWGDVLFIRRGLLDIGSMAWETPLAITNGYSNAAECDDVTHVFRANQNDLFCSNATTHPPLSYLTDCAIPYGSVDAYISGSLYMAGIYVYTSIQGTNYECTLEFFQASMYVLFADYIAFASDVLGRSVSYYPYSDGISPQLNPGYTMKPPENFSPWVIEYGDFYDNQQIPPTTVGSSSATGGADKDKDPSGSAAQFHSNTGVSDLADSSNANTVADSGSVDDIIYNNGESSETDADDDNAIVFSSASEASSDLSKDTDGGLSNSQDKSKKKAVAIGVVCSILGCVILISFSLFVFKRWKRARLNNPSYWKTLSDNYSAHGIDTRVPPPIYTLSKPLLRSNYMVPPALRSAPLAQSHINGFDKDTYEVLEYYMPPLREPNTPSSFSSVSSQSTISSFPTSPSQWAISSYSASSSQSTIAWFSSPSSQSTISSFSASSSTSPRSPVSSSPSSIYHLYRKY